MNKGRAVALLLAGAAAGVGGRQAAEALLAPAAAANAKPVVHAVDLRREQKFGASVRISAYGWVSTDGGVRDIGHAKSCKAPVPSAQAFLDSLDCEW